MPDIHPSMQRLLQSAQIATAKSKAPITDYAGIGDALGVSAAVITNWKSRGVSKQGAIKAAAAWHCTVDWILAGTGTPAAMLIDGQHRWFSSLKDLDPQKVLLEALNVDAMIEAERAIEARAQSEEEQRLLTAFRCLPNAERESLIRDVTSRAALLNDMLARYLAERGEVPPPSAAPAPGPGHGLRGMSVFGELDELPPAAPAKKTLGGKL